MIDPQLQEFIKVFDRYEANVESGQMPLSDLKNMYRDVRDTCDNRLRALKRKNKKKDETTKLL